MEVSSQFLTANIRIVFLPAIAYILCVPVIFWWTITTVYIYGLGTPKYDEYNFVATVEGDQASDGMFIYFLFGLFWIVAFLIAIQIFATSCTTCMWYFHGQNSEDEEGMGKVSVWMAVKWAMTYHLGSLAFGAFLVAVVTMIRVICEYIMYQYEKSGGASKDNAMWKCVKCCVRCTLKCLDCCVKFINKNAYIQIALHNSNFCTAAKESFYLNIRHGGRFAAVALIGGILGVLG
jgi:choline transporter-like protein 2/4/5